MRGRWDRDLGESNKRKWLLFLFRGFSNLNQILGFFGLLSARYDKPLL